MLGTDLRGKCTVSASEPQMPLVGWAVTVRWRMLAVEFPSC